MLKPATRILINPRAGRGFGARLFAELRARNDLDVRSPDSPEALTEEARRAAAEGLERLLVAGGDGTLHHAIRGLAGTETALGIVPAGTGNDLARALGLDLNSRVAVERARLGPIRSIDLGRVDGRPYVGVAALGFDSEVLDFMRRPRPSILGRHAYGYAVVRTLLTFKSPTLRIESPGHRFHGPAMLAVVANSPLFGGGMRIAPRARLDDGWLDLVVVKPVSLFESLRLFPSVYRGTHVDHPAVTCHRVREATLFADRAITVNGDGEPLSRTRAAGTRVDVWPDALRVVAHEVGAGTTPVWETAPLSAEPAR